MNCFPLLMIMGVGAVEESTSEWWLTIGRDIGGYLVCTGGKGQVIWIRLILGQVEESPRTADLVWFREREYIYASDQMCLVQV